MEGCGCLILLILLCLLGAAIGDAFRFVWNHGPAVLGISVALVVAWKFFQNKNSAPVSPRSDRDSPSWDPEKAAEIRELTERPIFLAVAILAKFAKADGVVTRNEIAAVEEILASFDLSPADRNEAIRVFTKHKSGALSYQESLQCLADLVENQYEFRWWMCGTLLRLAHADGSPPREALQNARLACGILDIDYAQLYASMQNREGSRGEADPSDYELLGCSPRDSIQTIKKRYRELAKTFHPDTMSGKDIHPEIMKLATEKLRKVQEAYERILAQRGS